MPTVAKELRAGPLTLLFDGAGLRSIRLGERDLLSRVHVVVRDQFWNTIGGTINDLEVTADDDRFMVGFVARHASAPVNFEWRGRIEGSSAGEIVFRMEGQARSTFLRNRIGICVLHPIEPFAGRPCVIEQTDGSSTSREFPRAISPHQPFLNIAAMRFEAAPGVEVELRFSGDVFETEDQRNWSDASYKTYSTPLALPIPVEVTAGTRIVQEVRIAVRGTAAVTGAKSTGSPHEIACSDHGPTALPKIGLAVASDIDPPSPKQMERLRALSLSHLRADVHLADPMWREALSRAAAQAKTLRVGLEVAVFAPAGEFEASLDAFASALGTRESPLSAVLLLQDDQKVTPERLSRRARELLGRLGVPLGGGTNHYFAELNRGRPAMGPLDLVCVSVTPQVHESDDATVAENAAIIRWMGETARAFADGRALCASPITLRPRFNPLNPAQWGWLPGRDDGLPFAVDARQATAFAAAWTVANLASAAQAGFARLTYFETVGAKGVMETEKGTPWPALFPSTAGTVFPVYHVLADVGELSGGQATRLCTRNEAITGLLLERDGRRRGLLANLSARPQSLALRLPARQARLSRLAASTLERATRDPEGFRSDTGTLVDLSTNVPLELEPYETVRLDLGDER